MSDRLNTDCRDGYHSACDGYGWDFEADAPCRCECECHSTRCDPVNGNDPDFEES